MTTESKSELACAQKSDRFTAERPTGIFEKHRDHLRPSKRPLQGPDGQSVPRINKYRIHPRGIIDTEADKETSRR